MKKLFRLIKIAFILVIGATFAEQINMAIDWAMAVDYNAVGSDIAMVSSKIADFAVATYNYVVGLFA